MSCMQVTSCQNSIYNSYCAPSLLCSSPKELFQPRKTLLKLTIGSSTFHCIRLPETSLKLIAGASRYQRCTPVCLFGGKGKSNNENEASPWNALEKAMGGLKKEQSLEDVLRQQINKQEYYDDGGSGGNNLGGGGDGSAGSDDEGLSGVLDEVLQVVLATIGFIFLYIYIIEGEDITRLAKDFIKFLFGGQKSVRLRRTFYQWGKFYQRLTRKKREIDPYWLERAIITTPTWWDSPEKYKSILRAYVKSRSHQ